MNKILITLGAFLVGIVLLGVAYQNQNLVNQNVKYDTPTTKESHVSIGGHAVRVEMATTNFQKAKGLSGRKYLGTDDGMLFNLKNDNPPHMFWMKDMLIPIDIVWITGGEIVQINSDVQPPTTNTPDSELERITFSENADYVLEINAGFVLDHDIKEGDPFEFLQN